ncbi:type 2 periplasmic-binding domain-containing protein [Pyxidicoccus xibeiensis]|uniref:gliding motility protein n=1 Tax=Pyxidicoccus xibeiensis TaxID=2906759 RepID=UPI0020A74FEF|nr:gliding motility protein [Pyxidicoccus xibeiensis]MCP3139977.1 gliding motility protein [Pyxidicoccus xibeiensis]
MSESWQQRFHREAREMDTALRSVLARRQSDEELRAALEELARRPYFRDFTWLWGPALHVRDRVRFRPLLLSWFTPSALTAAGKWVDAWKGGNAAALKTWLDDADRADDVEVFRRLYAWKLAGLPRGTLDTEWREDVMRRFKAATTRSARHTALAKVDLSQCRLDEKTALALDTVDPEAARAFILDHLPWRWSIWGQRDAFLPLWTTLMERARARGDAAMASALYRRLVDEATWRRDVLALARDVREPEALLRELKEHHPEAATPGIAHVFVELAEVRGRDVVPYLLEHLRSVFPRWGVFGRRKNAKGLPELLQLARVRGWEDVWSVALRTSATAETFDAEVRRLVEDTATDEAVTRRRLLQVAGAGGEWNLPGLGLARVQPLTDGTAVALYTRFPELLRGPFRMHVASGWHAAYPKLVSQALQQDDEDLLDFLASRAAMHLVHDPKTQKDWVKVLDALASHYEALPKEGGVFARRAASALGAIPAFAVWDYDALLEKNRLARLFFQRSDDFYLAEPRAVRDLLEAPQIHVQALAFRLLGRDSPRARELAAENLDLLQATLLRPLHRRTRHAAFSALANAAAHGVEPARRLVPRLRDTFALPDTRYPKESLVALLAQVLVRWPELRGPSETPRVFGPTGEAERA